MRYLKILIPVFLISLLSPHAHSSISSASPITPNTLLSDVIKLSPRSYSRETGQQMNIKERFAFRLLKSSMKKAVRENPKITVGQFFESRREKEVGGSFLFVLALVIIFGFLVFVITFQGEPE